ncbi:MAG: hypothetical protein GTO45_00830 [Candidatus Aminicenantes bacterium]|nr:hypothetical protein [Candidatus Aminicenantes bacterium]NIM77307.1 hypothetical protein [Candidatus Aminicenantes bacterium]NIN16608.1 hypothetical protein [Candidatus Aminicenantes bacterium]NIN40466.1 hypothetical protein [Candidatus Aminicenantes bacterium]NIN83286.1 hypothetical protein [Candidatus Aminicenantes bacterium]
MKRVIITVIAVMFLFSGFGLGQDCGKCPLKSKCLPEKTVKKADVKKVSDPIVFAKKQDKYYHTKECKAVKLEGMKIKLSEAVKRGLKPCEKCDAPVLPPPPKTKKK